MKKKLLIFSATIGIAAGACAQGSLLLNPPDTTGVNSVTSNPNDPDSSGKDWFLNDGTGNLTVSVYYATNSANLLNEAQAINTDDQSAGTIAAGIALLNADFTQELFTGENGAAAALTQVIPFDYSTIDSPEQYTATVGSGSTITSGSLGMYALLVTYIGGYEGAIVLDGAGAAYNVGGGQNQAAQLNAEWPDQNLLIAPVPEPTTLALAGLGGLSMLFLRRRK